MHKTWRGIFMCCSKLRECDRDGIASKCFCDVYDILYKSRISTNNHNQMFFGCPFFKVKEQYCQYFVWLDEHLKKIRAMKSQALGAINDAEGIDVEDQLLRSQKLEKEMEELERKLLCIEKKKYMSLRHIIVISVIVVIIVVCFLKG
ncbi:hypothetical protein Ahy_A09g046400 [Arachis hypogaea]|uniref:Zinc finger GRF-type domain-containing protein n=1 Tax=Arachis hypogaea TaxID=3818 RepID=A0A445BPP5_ARAHY|nr:hypothetical protein Ahy_A09g046400 [Arachis hypogaea]